MNLQEVLEKVKEEHLSMDALGALDLELTKLHEMTTFEKARLEKLQAIFLNATEEDSNATRERKWSVTTDGQRLISVKAEEKVISKWLSSVRARIYQRW